MEWLYRIGSWFGQNWAAVVAGLLGLWGAVGAEHARRVAVRADVRAQRAEQRATERGDIRFESGWGSTAAWRLTNWGLDTAYEVTWLLTVDGEHLRKEATGIDAGRWIEVDLAEFVDRALARYEEQLKSPAIFPPSSEVEIEERITYRTASGVWKSQTIEDRSIDVPS